MKPAQELWTADQVREALRKGQKPIVMKGNGDFRNLTVALAIRLTGDFKVEVSAHEIVVHDSFMRIRD